MVPVRSIQIYKLNNKHFTKDMVGVNIGEKIFYRKLRMELKHVFRSLLLESLRKAEEIICHFTSEH